MMDKAKECVLKFLARVSHLWAAVANYLHRQYLRHVVPYLALYLQKAASTDTTTTNRRIEEKSESECCHPSQTDEDVSTTAALDDDDEKITDDDSETDLQGAALLDENDENEVPPHNEVELPPVTSSSEPPMSNLNPKAFLRRGAGLARPREQVDKGSGLLLRKSLFSSSSPRQVHLFEQIQASTTPTTRRPAIHTSTSSSALVDNLNIELEEMSNNYKRSTAELTNVHGELSQVKTCLEAALRDKEKLQAALEDKGTCLEVVTKAVMPASVVNNTKKDSQTEEVEHAVATTKRVGVINLLSASNDETEIVEGIGCSSDSADQDKKTNAAAVPQMLPTTAAEPEVAEPEVVLTERNGAFDEISPPLLEKDTTSVQELQKGQNSAAGATAAAGGIKVKPDKGTLSGTTTTDQQPDKECTKKWSNAHMFHQHFELG